MGLSSDPECRCILEEVVTTDLLSLSANFRGICRNSAFQRSTLLQYIFQFETDAMGNITLTLGDDAKGAKGRTNRASKPNINTARTQVVKLIRTVVAVTRTLDNIPKEVRGCPLISSHNFSIILKFDSPLHAFLFNVRRTPFS